MAAFSPRGSKNLQSLQVGDQVVLLVVGQHFLVGRHAVSALIHFGTHVGFGRLLAVVHLVAAEQAFQPRAHFLVGAVGVVAHATLLKRFLTLIRIAFLIGEGW